MIAVVTVAAQLADGLRKLVGFWKQVQNAPAEISALFDHLESLSFTLAQAESSQDECDRDPVASQVLRDCQEKVLLLCDKISVNACGLDSSSSKRRKWSAFKISLDKAEIESLRRAIDRAQTTLILSRVIAIQWVLLFGDTACTDRLQAFYLLPLCVPGEDSHQYIRETYRHSKFKEQHLLCYQI